MRLRIALASMLLAATASGCAQGDSSALTQGVGGVLGGVLGGFAGSQFGSGAGQLALTGLGSGLGGLFGGYLGGQVGSGFGEPQSAGYSPASYPPAGNPYAGTGGDDFHAEQARATATDLPLGGSVSWQNPDTGASGSITPVRDGTSAAGHYCRQFEDSRSVGGLPQTAILVACQQPDGTWYAVN